MRVHVYPGDLASPIPGCDVIPVASAADLAATLPEIEILVAVDAPRNGWSRATRLRLIHLLGVGADRLIPSLDLPDIVEIATMRGVFAVEVAEHAMTMMLAHVRRLRADYDDQRARRFDQTARGTLAGQHLVLVGLGAVGHRIDTLATAFGMRVTGVSRTNGVDLAAAVADADHVVFALPLTPQTHHMCNAELLARMSPRTHVVNVARGGIVDETALLDALGANRIAAASLDVFETEPLPPRHPLWASPRVTITPHVAGYAERYIDRCMDIVADNLGRLQRGEPLVGLVDRSAGY